MRRAIALRNAPDGALLRAPAQPGLAIALRNAPDGALLRAPAQPGLAIALRNAPDGALLRAPAQAGLAIALRNAPDGALLRAPAQAGLAIALRNAPDGALLRAPAQPGLAIALRNAPDGALLRAPAQPGLAIALRNAPDGALLRAPAQPGLAIALRNAPDGALLRAPAQPGLAIALAVAACGAPPVATKPPNWIADTSTFHAGAAPAASLADHYRDAAATIIAAARADRGAYAKLEVLTDRIGHRLSGSPELDRAIEWAQRAMTDDGQTVRTEKVMIPHWVRGQEDAAITEPVQRDLHLLGLGGTVATPKGGVTAPVVVVHDWAELDAKRDAVKGAIVVFDVAMPAYTEAHGAGYGETVEYRWKGAIEAAKRGAVAALIRSVTAHSLRTPHTGSTGYDDAVAKIPYAAVTVEDAELIDRLAAQGPVTVHLRLDDQTLPDVPSANVVGELRGKELPDEVVVLGAHLDSWDVGQGAHDDGAGCVTMMQALATLRRLGLTPRRTVRVVLFVNEENGLRGAKQYARDHASELANTVLAFESDSGGFAPRGWAIKAKDPAVQARAAERLAVIGELVRVLGLTKMSVGNAGADVSPMLDGGVVAGELATDGRSYFDIHHTDADTLDKVDPQALADDVAAVAVLAYVVADMPGRLDSP